MTYIMTDGANTKALNPFDLDSNPEAWTWLSNAPEREIDNIFYKVAASFRAVNKRAVAASNVPFAIMKGEEPFDDSTAWENKVKFLPKPKDLIKRISLSLTFKNAAYLLQGRDVLHQTKGLHFLVPTTITPIVSPSIGDVDYYERNINGRVERIAPTDPKLIKIWLLDHTTELLPSKHTAVDAIFNSAGSLYFADLFIKNFYERGGVKPTVLALKGAVFNERREDIERGWSKFLRNLSRFSSKIFNAETMDVKPIGAGVDDLKNNEVYRQAIENIALGIGMPTSHLLSDWDSYATATVDYMMWQRDDIFPLCEAIAEDLNLQIFTPMGLRLEFLTEISDSETQDPVAQATAYQTFVDTGMLASVAAKIVGLEMPDGIEYEELDGMGAEEEGEPVAGAEGTMGAPGGEGGVQQQALNGAQVSSLIEVLTLVAEGQIPRASGIEVIVASFPVTVQQAERMMGEIGQGFEPEEVAAPMGQMPPGADGQPAAQPQKPKGKFGKPLPPAKWIPTLTEYDEMRVWQDVALRRFKKGDGLDFEYQPHYGGIPAEAEQAIRAELLKATSADEIKAAFQIVFTTTTPAPAYKSETASADIIMLAAAMNKLAEADAQKAQQQPIVIVNNQKTKRIPIADIFTRNMLVNRVEESNE